MGEDQRVGADGVEVSLAEQQGGPWTDVRMLLTLVFTALVLAASWFFWRGRGSTAETQAERARVVAPPPPSSPAHPTQASQVPSG
jgi:hypothetical protein